MQMIQNFETDLSLIALLYPYKHSRVSINTDNTLTYTWFISEWTSADTPSNGDEILQNLDNSVFSFNDSFDVYEL